MIDVAKMLPEMLAGEELMKALTVLPNYDKDIRNRSETERLIALNDLYNIYIPNAMSTEIYSKMYLALIRSLNKKFSKEAVVQRNSLVGVIGGADSFTITGCGGIGKSASIGRAVVLIAEKKTILTDNWNEVIPILSVQCPFDSSVKALLLSILKEVDSVVCSDYYEKALKVRATTDTFISMVSKVALNHIGLLIVDEIQNVVNSKNGRQLVGMLTQLINSSGISICMVGTPACEPFFEQEMHLARRTLGLKYGPMSYDENFIYFCRTLWEYQCVKNKSEITDAIVNWLYEHSGGIASVVVSLLHDAQEIAILNGTEELSLANLNEAYKSKLSMLHSYIDPSITKKAQTSTKKRTVTYVEESQPIEEDNLISKLVAKSKAESLDILSLFRQHFEVVEVAV